MAQGDDFSGRGWLDPISSRDTEQSKTDRDDATRDHAQRPRLGNSPWTVGEVVSGFKLIQMVGYGSQGWVYEALEIATDKTVALKLVPSATPKAAVRSKTGFRRMKKLQHHGLVRLHRILQEEDAVAFSMELIDGENLVQVLRRWKKLPLQEGCERLLEMLRQVGAALAWLHAYQLVHRDIKPTNLMMTHDGSRFVIVDCDLAGEFEAESDPQNTRKYLLWTPMYVAPEVLFRQSYCPASDIFSLGMVALEALRMFSSAQRRRDRQLHEAAAPNTDPAALETDEEEIPRDDKSSDCDREYILSAMVGLHSEIPSSLLEIVHEMLSPQVCDRPTAMAVARVGSSGIPIPPLALQNRASARAAKITESAREKELAEFRRWCHLIMGGQVKRLHIDGTSGIGKSTFLQLAIEHLRSQSWPLVFVARCQRFEQIPLQAFSQIADEIVIRHRRGDFDKLPVDSVSESILQRALPGFGEVLEVDWSQPPIVTSEKRPGGLEAALKVCDQLRQIGPVFFVIDDVQWADQDTLHTLDHMQSSAGTRVSTPLHQGLGLITVSRSGGDRQQFPPDANISLRPLTRDIIAQAILSEASLQGVDINDTQLDALNEQIEGQPYRLDAYLSELSPSGLLNNPLPADVATPSNNGVPPPPAGQGPLASHEALSNNEVPSSQQASTNREAPSIEDVWRHRSDRLSQPVADLLNAIVVAGRQVTFQHLCAIEPNAALLDTQLEELVEQRLIVRDGSDGQFIRVWHDRLANQLRSALPAEQRHRLHRQWAVSLTEFPLSAGRIAEHYEQAGDINEFVKWAKRAAEQAQQVYAHLEAARWHRSVAAHCDGADRIDALRLAAESLQRSGRPFEAGQIYHELSELLDGQPRLDIELEQVDCFIRSGRFAEAVEYLDPLLARLNLPRRKSPLAAKLSIAWMLLRRSVSKPNLELPASQLTPPRPDLQGNQIAACGALVRPLSMLDNLLSAELNVFSSELVNKYGSRAEKIEWIIGTSVFASYRPGRKRDAATNAFAKLGSQLTDDDSPGCHGDVRSGAAWAAGMSGRFREALEYIEQARRCYADSERHHGFEVAHASCLEAVCYFQMGNLTALASMVDDMQLEGTLTNDFFVLAMGSLGYSSTAFLMRGDLAALHDLYDQLIPRLQKIGNDAFAMAAPTETLLRAIYRNRRSDTEAVIARVEMECRRSTTHRSQMVQILLAELSAIANLSLLSQRREKQHRRFHQLITSLRRQRLDAAEVKADLIEGIAMVHYPSLFSRQHQQVRDQAHRRLVRAAESAENQGLTPTALAAQDELALLGGEENPTKLEQFLAEQGVADVPAFARLYRGARD
ncbi:serine/threonine-protein kinase [Allorhodopirellula solitaria]|uniref:Serine/threonine-protein kinase PknA n=1 Tax=Allorhodopirellula solitaria TaxID=2527987 RepID=A0A5C5YFJ6_9BACT|nr:serine/threonine-protein kinase [Allorhodopirellula solitaria]TWT74060.1 Serine/threonine-protein kinase PknA [Allorhodopirellula solitaria]